VEDAAALTRSAPLPFLRRSLPDTPCQGESSAPAQPQAQATPAWPHTPADSAAAGAWPPAAGNRTPAWPGDTPASPTAATDAAAASSSSPAAWRQKQFKHQVSQQVTPRMGLRSGAVFPCDRSPSGSGSGSSSARSGTSASTPAASPMPSPVKSNAHQERLQQQEQQQQEQQQEQQEGSREAAQGQEPPEPVQQEGEQKQQAGQQEAPARPSSAGRRAVPCCIMSDSPLGLGSEHQMASAAASGCSPEAQERLSEQARSGRLATMQSPASSRASSGPATPTSAKSQPAQESAASAASVLQQQQLPEAGRRALPQLSLPPGSGAAALDVGSPLGSGKRGAEAPDQAPRSASTAGKGVSCLSPSSGRKPGSALAGDSRLDQTPRSAARAAAAAAAAAAAGLARDSPTRRQLDF
jgi:hypothetical protein